MYVGRRGRTSILKAEDKGTSTGKVVYVTWHDGSARAINFTSRELCAYTEAVACKAKISQCDRLISSLPVHHVAEQLVALQLPVVTGCSVAYYTAARYTGVSDFVDFLHATRPTVFGTTPRMWERLCFYSLYTWKKKSRVQDVLVKVIKRCKNRGTASQSIEAEFLPVASPNGKHKKRVCEKRENPQRLLGLENTHLAYCYREQRPKVSRFFAMRGLKIACVDGFPEAGGMCTFRRSTKDGARSLLGTEEDSHKQPKWRKERMLLTQRGDYIPKDFTESLFFKYNRDSIIEKATLVSNTQQSIGVVIYVNGKVASELLAVPVNRLWRSRDLSEYLRDIVNKVNENLQYDQRISCFTQCIICKGDENVEEGTWSEKEIIAQMYREENLI